MSHEAEPQNNFLSFGNVPFSHQAESRLKMAKKQEIVVREAISPETQLELLDKAESALLLMRLIVLGLFLLVLSQCVKFGA